MRPITTEGFEKPKSTAAGAAPMLQWLKITDLVIDPAYQRPIIGKGRQNVDRIARAFSWSCFAPVVVSPVEGGKFARASHQVRIDPINSGESVPTNLRNLPKMQCCIKLDDSDAPSFHLRENRCDTDRP
jgi:hypothetical protein